jgi:hypothetical protein
MLVTFVGCHHCVVTPSASTVDSSPGASSDGNGVFEPGETVAVVPAWGYYSVSGGSCVTCPTSVSVIGTASDFTGPGGAVYSVVDAGAQYSISLGQSGDCGETGDCYLLSVSSPQVRPATHWDATFVESSIAQGSASAVLPAGVSSLVPDACGITAYPKIWTLHIGDSFSDVPRSSSFYRNIETLLHDGIAAGCSPTEYCPAQTVSRGPMAVFLARGIAGGDANVPVTGTVNGSPYLCAAGGVSLFADVAPTDDDCRHVHFLAAQNVMPGCSPSNFCPSDAVSRDGMAGITAEALVRPGGDAAVPLSYGPDPGTGRSYSCDAGSPNVHFTDVPVSDPFCKHVHYLWATGIIGGCSPTSYCPSDGLSREAMSEFLVQALQLELYGVGAGIPQPACAATITSSGSTTFCPGGSVTLDAGPGYSSYLWSPGGATTRTLVASVSGDYTVTTTDVNGCTGTSSPMTVTVSPPPVAVASGSATICPRTATRLSGTGGVACTWSPVTGLTDPYYCSPIAAPSTTTTYSLVVTDAAGCSSTNEASATITVSPGPSPPVMTLTKCIPAGAPGLLASVPGAAGDAYAWTVTGGAITSGQGTTEITFSSGAAGTLMTVQVLETNPAGCSANAIETAQVDFDDVSENDPFYSSVCTIGRDGITAGCGGGDYCRDAAALRKQMAVFVLKSKEGSAYVPAPATGIFADVPASDPFAPWIEDLYRRGVVAGCGAGPTYCPNQPVLRQQMAVYLLKTLLGSDYVPPACAGVFLDVPCSNPFAPWIEDLYNRSIAAGCGAGNYCPTSATTRGQMAVFLVKTFTMP